MFDIALLIFASSLWVVDWNEVLRAAVTDRTFNAAPSSVDH